MRRRGFTLVEMLVATGIFLVGFVGVFGLFLAGVRFRKQAEDIARCSVASTSLIEEIRLDAGREASAPHPPSDYLGDGLAGNGTETGSELHPYVMQPGVWYRVEQALNFEDPAADNPATTALRIRLLVLTWSTSDSAVTLDEIARRLQLLDTGGVLLTDPDLIADELVKRGIAMRSEAVIIRHPSWMP